jgi:hypothetical protein
MISVDKKQVGPGDNLVLVGTQEAMEMAKDLLRIANSFRRQTMKRNPLRNQRGWGLMDIIFWAVIIAGGVWAVKQYALHPEGLNPRGTTHSQYEDSK